MTEFATIILVCENPECPEVGVEKPAMMKLEPSGALPWVVCGVCQADIVSNPNETIE